MSEIKRLYFAESGWCPEIEQSYSKGFYLPKNKAEFDALKKYASDPNPSASETEKESEEVVELKKHIQFLEDANAGLNGDLSVAEKALTESQAKVDELTGKLEASEKALAESQANAKELLDQLKAQAKQIQELQKKNK